jgi:hypothetical protein
MAAWVAKGNCRALVYAEAVANQMRSGRASTATCSPPRPSPLPREDPRDQLGIDTDNAIASLRQLAIPARVGGLAPGVIAAINFDDQTNGWREKIYNEAKQRHLPTERDAELA